MSQTDAMQSHLAGIQARAEMLHSPDTVERAVDAMALAIGRGLRGRDPLLLCVMNGAVIPTAMLMLRLDFPLRLDYIHATRYQGQTRGGELHWKRHPAQPLRGEEVLIVDDIFDEGTTLSMIADYCHEQGARSVRSAVLVEKRRQRDTGYRPDFVGLEVADRYVFGAGLDYKEYLRNLPGIYAVADEDL
jgi:hypoxanthine phosphoribosyltransferase